nr:MAG TPA: hypothetical protein [Caudoviricetes sp.]
MGYSTGNSLRKKLKTRKQEEREQRMKSKITTRKRRSTGKVDQLNKLK